MVLPEQVAKLMDDGAVNRWHCRQIQHDCVHATALLILHSSKYAATN